MQKKWIELNTTILYKITQTQKDNCCMGLSYSKSKILFSGVYVCVYMCPHICTHVLVMKVEKWGRGPERGCEREGGDGIYLPWKENKKLFEKQGNQQKVEEGEMRKAVENRKKV